MNAEIIIPAIVRWIHISCAALAIGGPFFVRFALMPAAAHVLDDDAHQKLRAALNARWRPIVYTLITLFILTGLYNFLVPNRVHGMLITARWKDFAPEDRHLYHLLFGIKMLAAFSMFFLASALAGRSPTFAPIRKRARLYVSVLLILAAVVLACAILMHMLPHGGELPANLPITPVH